MLTCRELGDQRARAHRMIVDAATDLSPDAVVALGREPSGRPILIGGRRQLHISMSHCPGMVAVALTGLGPVGVDIEARRQLDAIAMAGRWFAPAETQWLQGFPADAQVDAFLRLWVAKEAVGKALGLGLRGTGLRREMPRPRGGVGRWEAVAGDGGLAVATMAGGDYFLGVGCAAMAARGAAIVVRELDPQH